MQVPQPVPGIDTNGLSVIAASIGLPGAVGTSMVQVAWRVSRASWPHPLGMYLNAATELRAEVLPRPAGQHQDSPDPARTSHPRHHGYRHHGHPDPPRISQRPVQRRATSVAGTPEFSHSETAACPRL